MKKPCEVTPGEFNSNVCVAEGCYGEACVKPPGWMEALADEVVAAAWARVESTVNPLFGRKFTVKGPYFPTRMEMLFGRRHRHEFVPVDEMHGKCSCGKGCTFEKAWENS